MIPGGRAGGIHSPVPMGVGALRRDVATGLGAEQDLTPGQHRDLDGTVAAGIIDGQRARPQTDVFAGRGAGHLSGLAFRIAGVRLCRGTGRSRCGLSRPLDSRGSTQRSVDKCPPQLGTHGWLG